MPPEGWSFDRLEREGKSICRLPRGRDMDRLGGAERCPERRGRSEQESSWSEENGECDEKERAVKRRTVKV